MNLVKLYRPWQNALDKTLVLEGIAPLLLRLYLAPIMLQVRISVKTDSHFRYFSLLSFYPK
jgi:hypothetical protein